MRWTIYRDGDFWAEFDSERDFLEGWESAMSRYDAHKFTYRFITSEQRQLVNQRSAEYFGIA